MTMMQFQILKTTLVDDRHYIDLVNSNGAIFTQLMHKVSEPNNFAILKEESGDTTLTIAKDLK